MTIAAAVRLILAATVPLVPDETYYWEWSRRLASGYFDHPGAIAHLVSAGTAIAGVTPLGVRLGAVAAGWLTSLCLVLLARRLSDDAGALRAAVIITCIPLAAAGLVLATPDAPLLLTTAATLLFLDLALSAPVGSRTALGWWLVAGVMLGLAFVSKYNAVLLPVGVLLALLVYSPLRRQLATPAPYLAALVALLIFAPVIVWNAGHDWISFHFQLSHGLGHGHGSALRREASLIGSQLGLVSPILFVLLVAAVYRALRRRAPFHGYYQRRSAQLHAARRALLATVAASTFLFFCWSALSRRAEPNWQAMSYIPAIALLASYSGNLRWRRWLGGACALGATMVAIVYLQATSPFLPIEAGSDPVARGAGWNVLASRMQDAARLAARDDVAKVAGRDIHADAGTVAGDGVVAGADVVGDAGVIVNAGVIANSGAAPHMHAGPGSDTRAKSSRVWFAGNRYQDASEIAFHLPNHPEVFSLNIASRPNEYDIWPSFAERAQPGDDLVLALIPPAPGRPDTVISTLRPHFDRVTHVERAKITDGADLVRDVWVLEGWRGGERR